MPLAYLLPVIWHSPSDGGSGADQVVKEGCGGDGDGTPLVAVRLLAMYQVCLPSEGGRGWLKNQQVKRGWRGDGVERRGRGCREVRRRTDR